jgi:hypothetical protein
MNQVFPTQPTLMEDTFAEVDKEFDQFASVLQISKPKTTLCSVLTQVSEG